MYSPVLSVAKQIEQTVMSCIFGREKVSFFFFFFFFDYHNNNNTDNYKPEMISDNQQHQDAHTLLHKHNR